jgi:hexosaminidase
MKIKYLLYAALILSAFLANQPLGAGSMPGTTVSVMPLPARLILNSGKMPLDSSFTVYLSGHRDPRLQSAVSRFLKRLQKKTGISFALLPTAGQDASQSKLVLYCSGAGERIQSPAADESYALEVTSQSSRLSANSPIGILRGLETFLQLIDLDNGSFSVPALRIDDRPRFCWRGLHIDVSRHWEPVEIIRRNLDAMAAMKMNVFHWHLSDDQGFRVESKAFPKLHQKGSDGNYYTQAQISDIVAYAGERGIRVVPEFDVPGHSAAWLVGYPELASAPGPYQIERGWGVFDPCMDPTQKKLYSFLDSFVGEMAKLFPDEYFHIGGDEVSGKQWNASKKIQLFKKRNRLKDNRDLQSYFNQRLVKILEKHGKRMIGWDEIFHPNLPKNIVVQSWRGQASLANSAQRGFAGILSYGYYLDHMQTAEFHYTKDPLGKEAANLTSAEQKLILGGEACMWGEFITPENIESRIWPRTAAIAERLWSQAEVQDVSDMYRRLDHANRELDLLGIHHQSNYLEMLQKMAGDNSVTPLKMLADLLKATSLGVRQRSGKYYSTTALNRMADVVLPESDTARQFGYLVDSALSDAGATEEVRQNIIKLLSLWRENGAQVKPLIEKSSLLKEIAPVSETIADLSVRGLQALDYIASRQKPPETWRKECAALLAKSEKPQAEVLIAIVPPIKKLVTAANAIPAEALLKQEPGVRSQKPE